MKKIIAIVLAALMVCAMLTACGGKEASGLKTVESGKLIMATNAAFPPYEFKEGDGYAGIDVEIAGLIAEKLGIKVEICELGLFDLYTADEVIVSGTAAELCAIVKIDGRAIGSGVPGPVYKKLLADFQEETKIGDAY